MAHEVFPITIDGENFDLTEDNHTIAMFRDTPEYDSTYTSDPKTIR